MIFNIKFVYICVIQLEVVLGNSDESCDYTNREFIHF